MNLLVQPRPVSSIALSVLAFLYERKKLDDAQQDLRQSLGTWAIDAISRFNLQSVDDDDVRYW